MPFDFDETLNRLICCENAPECNCSHKVNKAKRHFRFYIRKKGNPSAAGSETHIFHSGSASWLKELMHSKKRHYERLDLEIYDIKEEHIENKEV